jgi:hypothetical protein
VLIDSVIRLSVLTDYMIIVSRERNRMNKIDIKILGEALKNGQEAMENIKYTAEKLGLKIVKDEEVNK